MRPFALTLLACSLGIVPSAFAQPTPPAASAEPWQIAPSSGSAERASPEGSPPALRRRSQGMMTAGIVLSVLGGLSLIAGGTVIVVDVVRANAPGSDVGPIGALWLGTPLVGAGVLFAGIGIPLWVVGAQKVPEGQGSESGWARPAIGIGPQSATVRWTF